jgi:hypothetical protein
MRYPIALCSEILSYRLSFFEVLSSVQIRLQKYDAKIKKIHKTPANSNSELKAVQPTS